MPLSIPLSSDTSMMTVSISTCASLMSIASMMASTVGTSSFWVITTRPLMRLSARTVVFSLESSPACGSPVRLLVDGRDAEPVVMFAPPPVEVFAAAFWLDFVVDLPDGALPMRSLIMSETSSASAYLRR